MASIVKLGGTVQTPTITFNDGDQALYINDSIGFGWLKWEDSDWYTYGKGEFEPGKYCYYTNIHVENWEEYAFSDNVTVNWDGKPCDRPTDRAPSQIFVSSPVYIIPETVELVTATSSDINSIPKVGGAMTVPTFTVQTGQPARFREDYPYCAWFKKVDGAWKECGLHVDMDKIFTEGTYRYCVYLFIGGKGHTEDRESYVFSPDSKVIVNGTMWETWSYKVTDTFSWLRVFSPEYTISAVPAAPVVKAGNSATSGKPMLTWDAVDGATSYRVYRATSQNGPYRLLGSVTTTTYVNTGAKDGVTYYYKVTAVNDSGESAYSNIVSGQNKAVTPKPAAPVVKIGHSASSGKPMLTWNAVSGATSYKVYRATAKNGAYSVINTTKALTYTNTGAALGTTYYYKVEALNAAGKSLGFSDVVEGKVAPVLAVGYSSVSGKPQLTWKAVPGATEYQVYRSTQQNSGYTKINTTTATSYVNTGAKAGTTYYYRIVAVKGTAVSDFSNIVSARPSK
jgi:fibronectin type 3 domain-containing protein